MVFSSFRVSTGAIALAAMGSIGIGQQASAACSIAPHSSFVAMSQADLRAFADSQTKGLQDWMANFPALTGAFGIVTDEDPFSLTTSLKNSWITWLSQSREVTGGYWVGTTGISHRMVFLKASGTMGPITYVGVYDPQCLATSSLAAEGAGTWTFQGAPGPLGLFVSEFFANASLSCSISGAGPVSASLKTTGGSLGNYTMSWSDMSVQCVKGTSSSATEWGPRIDSYTLSLQSTASADLPGATLTGNLLADLGMGACQGMAGVGCGDVTRWRTRDSGSAVPYLTFDNRVDLNVTEYGLQGLPLSLVAMSPAEWQANNSGGEIRVSDFDVAAWTLGASYHQCHTLNISPSSCGNVAPGSVW